MDKIPKGIEDILNSEEGKENLKNILSMLTGKNSKTDTSKPDVSKLDLSKLDLSKLGDILNAVGGSSDGKQEDEDEGKSFKGSDEMDLNGLDINMLMKIQSMLSGFKGDDSTTTLIQAIKPHLKPERQAKADNAIKILHLLSMLPMLKESGLLGDLFG